MNWHKPINSLDLYNYPVSNHQIRPKATVKPYFLVHDWDQLLTLNRCISQRQLISQALFVCRLQQTRAKMAVHLYRRPDNQPG